MTYVPHSPYQEGRPGFRIVLAGLSLASILAFAPSAQAATLCVDQHGKPGCLTTISAAVSTAAPGDTIKVDAGTYKEDVLINKPVSLVGADRDTTIIDATSQSNGIYIDGFDNLGLAQVVVSGFTVENANFEGILVNEADAVTVSGNLVTGNDKGLQASSAACPGLPLFETAEGADCGSGIHLIGTTHSLVAENVVQKNAGGILISDETATSHDNVVTRNLVQNNTYASGIALSSNPVYNNPSAKKQSLDAFGVYNNTVLHNESANNGFGGPVAGGGGVALFANGVGTRAYANAVAGNRLISNAMPGVVLHNSVTGTADDPDLNRNTIVGNYIAGNGADPSLPNPVPTGISLLGTTPIVDTMIANNVIAGEQIGVAFSSASTLEIHLNDFLGGKVGIANLLPTGSVDATENWWGCSAGPGAAGCSITTGTVPVVFTPWLTGPVDGTFGHCLDVIFDCLHQLDCDHDGNH